MKANQMLKYIDVGWASSTETEAANPRRAELHQDLGHSQPHSESVSEMVATAGAVNSSQRDSYSCEKLTVSDCV